MTPLFDAGVLFVAGLLLIFNIWSERRAARPISGIQRELTIVKKCLAIMRAVRNKCVYISRIVSHAPRSLLTVTARAFTCLPFWGFQELHC